MRTAWRTQAEALVLVEEENTGLSHMRAMNCASQSNSLDSSLLQTPIKKKIYNTYNIYINIYIVNT